ncbi:MAG: hypothetical protein ACOCXQ_01585 [Patescibacteria group bacterium]
MAGGEEKPRASTYTEEKVFRILLDFGLGVSIECGDGWQATSHTHIEWLRDLRAILKHEYSKRFRELPC